MTEVKDISDIERLLARVNTEIDRTSSGKDSSILGVQDTLRWIVENLREGWFEDYSGEW